MLDQRLGIAIVRVEAAAERLGRVVGPTLRGDALLHPFEQRLLVADLEVEHYVEVLAELSQQFVERLGLRSVAGEAVEYESVLRVVTAQTVSDQIDHQLVRDEVASVVDL